MLRTLRPTTRAAWTARPQLKTRSYAAPPPPRDDNSDFRPPWVYTTSHVLTYTLIPTALVYCVFLADWGDREHVFMPARRWVAQYKASFFSLSPDEAALVRANSEAALVEAKANTPPPPEADTRE
ncbi:hypothetical protein BV22DRAFT_1121940 [Leucogyrophana mollusca]|uniref:Uncharacterized protein n=1 Tax=Leucogyrophana mollusca TaxID=85980 RepID=A0ACB8B878_9AGAM|nr:hypothetical protein BV22DRAFT_1121940 [Leucogyrophana mollusca]